MKEDKFTYIYSAPTQSERREIENIKSRYEKKEKSESKLERLKRLDGKVKKVPLIIAIIIGVAGCLIFGTGMTLALEWRMYAAGVAVGAVGAVIMIADVFLHKFLAKKFKEKYGAEILQLSEEILKGEKRA